MPTHVYKTVEAFRMPWSAVRETLRQGLYGWQVTDCTRHHDRLRLSSRATTWPGTTASDFRLLTPLVLMGALKQAGTVVCEPMHRFHLEIPADTFGAIDACTGAAACRSADPGDAGFVVHAGG